MKKRILNLIRLGVTYNEVTRLENSGAMDFATAEAYRRVWDWSAPRFSGIAGIQHDAFWKRHGAQAYYDRINKVRLSFGMDLLIGRAR